MTSAVPALHDQPRATIYQPILDKTRLVIAVILRRQEPTPKGRSKLCKLAVR